MAGFNKVILIGNMVADPELKTTPNGISVTAFRIAVGRKVAKQGASPQTDFIDIVAWRTTAEFVCKYFSKGKSILVCGALQSRKWDDKDGNKRTSWEVVADEVTFVEKKNDGGNTAASNPHGGKQEPEYEEMNSDEDLPF